MSDVSNESRQLFTLNRRYRSVRFACFLDGAPQMGPNYPSHKEMDQGALSH